jgi:prepilin-type N-terminal cleavage/methylation domain-containing protein
VKTTIREINQLDQFRLVPLDKASTNQGRSGQRASKAAPSPGLPAGALLAKAGGEGRGEGELFVNQEGHGEAASRAFTLIELLVVIAIIGLLAGLSAPVLHNFRPNYTASVTQQLLTDLARARQLAISQHTTVYMVFVPTNFWNDPAYGVGWNQADLIQASNLFEKQLVGYNLVSLRSMGDQPGRPSVHYLSSWKTLPEGGFILPTKFLPPPASATVPLMNIFTNTPNPAFQVFAFDYANVPTPGSPVIPFPLETTTKGNVRNPYVRLPYIAFDYMGRLASNQGGGQGAILPLVRGSVLFSRDKNKRPQRGLPSIIEQPVGNATNGFNLVYVDRITGRARALQQEVR